MAVALGLVAGMLPLTAAASQSGGPRGLAHACGQSGLEVPAFSDVAGFANDTVAAIECMAGYEITVGYADGTFAPGQQVRRYQMALFLSRVLDYADVHGDYELPGQLDDPGFTDTSGLDGEAQRAIGLLYTLGITGGTSETTFSPNANVNRRDMARFLARIQAKFLDAGGGYDLAQLNDGSADFADVPKNGDFAGAAAIYGLAHAGIVAGHADGNYRPFEPVARGHMALFVMRHVDENVASGRLPALYVDQGSDPADGGGGNAPSKPAPSDPAPSEPAPSDPDPTEPPSEPEPPPADPEEVALTSLQQEIDDASEGDTIRVASGTLGDDVTISVDGVTVEGPHAGKSGFGEGRTFHEAAIEGTVTIDADNVTLDGLSVEVTGSDEAAVLVGSGVTGAAITNMVVASASEGVHVDGATDVTVSDSKFTSAYVHVLFEGGATGNVEGNRLSGHEQGGVVATGTSTAVDIVSNEVTGSGARTDGAVQNGIEVSHGATAEVRGNTVADHYWADNTEWESAGIFVNDTSGVLVVDNTITGSDLGLWLIGSDHDAVSNTVETSDDTNTAVYNDGINVDGDNISVRDNSLSNSRAGNDDIGIVVVDGSSETMLCGNQIDGFGDAPVWDPDEEAEVLPSCG